MSVTTRASINEGYYMNNLVRLSNAAPKEDRTNTGTFSIFGDINTKYDLGSSEQRLVPLLSTKFVNYSSIVHELIWMLSGSSRIGYLKKNNVNIWDEWVEPSTAVYGDELSLHARIALVKKVGKFEGMLRELNISTTELTDMIELQTALNSEIIGYEDKMNCLLGWLNAHEIPTRKLVDGDLGPVYGVQWRYWDDTRVVPVTGIEDTWSKSRNFISRGYEIIGRTGRKDEFLVVQRKVDQITKIEEQLRINPFSRRIILNAWNVSCLEEMQLPPCHTLAQWGVEKNEEGVKTLSCKLYQRSCDYPIGAPYNIAFYSTLTHMLSAAHNLEPGHLHHSIGDCHMYVNQMEGVRTQINRKIKAANAPVITLPKLESILDYRADDIKLSGYVHDKYISMPVAV